MKCPKEHFVSHLRLIASLKDDSLVNVVWKIMVDLWHKYPPFSWSETMSMDKRWMDIAIQQGHTINCIRHWLAHIEKVIFRGMEFQLQSKFALELCMVES